MKTYSAIASQLDIIKRASQHVPAKGEWISNAIDTISAIMRNSPSGSGIDCGTKLSDDSTPDKLIFSLSFHHMDENGMYDGWTEHTAIVTPSLQFGFNLKISGQNRNEIKDYLHDIYSTWLNEDFCY